MLLFAPERLHRIEPVRVPMIEATQLAALQDDATRRWHRSGAEAGSASLPEPHAGASLIEALVLDQHRANFDLWHREDAARDPLAREGDIAEIKRAIDQLNQRRNDLVERLDLLLMAEAGQQNANAPLHSETPGLIIDRLSILSLKVFHTSEEAQRADAPPEHRDRNRTRLAVLTEQQEDLAGCLQALWTEVLAGQRRFKLYRQMKMYNDPTLNPVLYRKRSAP